MSVAYRQIGGQPPEIAYALARRDARIALITRLRASPLLSGTALTSRSDSLISDPYSLRAEHLRVSGVSIDFFATLGVTVVTGRELNGSDRALAAAAARGGQVPIPVMLSQRVWKRTFDGSEEIIGDVVEIAGRKARVVGIVGGDVEFPDGTNVWTPLTVASAEHLMPQYGRLADGATISQLDSAFPDLSFVSLRESVRPGETEGLAFLFGGAALLLLVAWAQVASLVFARAPERGTEIGVRMALGATRASLVRQLVLEGTILAAGALCVAWLCVPFVTDFIVARLPESMTQGQHLQADARAFTFAAFLSLVGMVLLSTLPVQIVRRAQPAAVLRQALGRLEISPARIRRVLLVIQMALTTALLYVAGTVVNSAVRVTTLDYGFDVDRVLVFRPPTALVGPRDQVRTEYARLQERIEASAERLRRLPDVTAVTTASAAPFVGHVTFGSGRFSGEVQTTDAIVAVNDRPVRAISVRPHVVGHDFVAALGARLVAGQALSEPQFVGNTNVTIVSEALAKQIAPFGPAVGLSIRPRWFSGRVVGVVQDLVDSRPGLEVPPQMFVQGPGKAAILVRTTSESRHAAAAVTSVLEQEWGRLPPGRVQRLSDDLDELLTPWRARSVLLSLIAGMCVPLAAVGIIGALAHTVRCRTREIAIRQALGASEAHVRRSVARQALGLTAAGLAVGLAFGFVAARGLESYLFGVGSVDGWSAISTTAILLSVAVLSAQVPARRASQIQPNIALRET